MINKIKENFSPFLFAGVVVGLLLFPIWSHNNLKRQISNIGGNGDILVGGPTKTVIGLQTKWLTDLVPSASFTVDLGSLTLPIDDLFANSASLSGNLNFLGELKPD